MGRILQPEKLGRFYKVSSTQVALEPSTYNIGGQQIRSLANVFLTPGTLTANTLYFVYINSSKVLSASLSAPTVQGTSYKLVGAFATEATGAVSFTINIEGAPQLQSEYVLSVTGSNSWSTVRAVGVPYKTCEGAWRLGLNINGTISSNTNVTITIAGIVTVAASQSVYASHDGGVSVAHNQSAFPSGANTIMAYTSGASVTRFVFAGDVELASMPTFLGANIDTYWTNTPLRDC
jgi:hypothetical protein